MGQNHSLPTDLARLRSKGIDLAAGSTARWARDGAQTCVVFVHGYGGRAVATWGDFPDLAMEHPAYAHADLIFVGYESRSQTADYSVAVIYDLLCWLAERNSALREMVGGPPRADDFAYSRIVLVGHSLGGALVRRVAQDAKDATKPWAETLDLALFAPAHRGAKAVQLAMTSFGFFKLLAVAEVAAYLTSPVLDDLKPDSDFLKALLAQAELLGEHRTTRAAFVAHAKSDRIVSQGRFYRDEPPKPYAGRNHVNCCKPARGGFLLPVEHLAEVLQ